MPTYTYLCEKIHGEFDEFHSITTKLEFCPKCQEAGIQNEVKRLISSGGSKGVVELYGDDLVNKVKSDAVKLQKDAAKNEYTYANLVGESTYQNLQTKMDQQNRIKRSKS